MLPANMSITDAFLRVLPNVFMFDGGRYVVATLLMSVFLWFVHRSSFRVRIIQNRRATPADYRREILASFSSVVVYALVATPSLWLRSNGYAVGQYQGSGSAIEIAAYVIVLLIVHDAYFYWTHRALHTRRLYKWHRLHHRTITPTPFAAYAFEWREAIVQALMPTIWICLVPTPFWAMFIFLGIMILRNVWGHSGAELHHAGFADHWFWGLFTTATHHDLHHSGNFGCNFGLYFTWWDRICGTEHPRYREIYREITSRPRASAEIVGVRL
jgi:Delta7-sterol 5-desaturase